MRHIALITNAAQNVVLITTVAVAAVEEESEDCVGHTVSETELGQERGETGEQGEDEYLVIADGGSR